MFRVYHDFEIQIVPSNATSYIISARGPGGDGREELVGLFNDPDYQRLSSRLHHLDVDESTLTQIGQTLFSSIFHDSVKDAYTRSQGMLGPDEGLRLRFDIA